VTRGLPLSFLALSLTAGLARAQGALDPASPVPVTAPATAEVVELVVVGTVEELAALQEVIGPRDFGAAEARWVRAERLRREDLLERKPQASEVAVRCFVRISPGRANLYFANRTAERFLVRQVELPNGLDATGREAIGQVLSLSVTALIEDAEAGLSRSETEKLLAEPHPVKRREPPAQREQEPAEAAPSRARASSSLGAAPFYVTKLHSREVSLVHGPGLRVGWVSDIVHAQRSFFVSASYEVPERYRVDAVGVAWETTSFHGGFELLWRLDGFPLLVGGRAGAGVDVVRFSPKSGTVVGGVVLTEARTSTVPVLTPAFAVLLPIGSRLGVGLDLFADLHPVRLAFALGRAAGTEEVLAPYRVRPGAALCLSVR
jgi:hypothetical protein